MTSSLLRVYSPIKNVKDQSERSRLPLGSKGGLSGRQITPPPMTTQRCIILVQKWPQNSPECNICKLQKFPPEEPLDRASMALLL